MHIAKLYKIYCKAVSFKLSRIILELYSSILGYMMNLYFLCKHEMIKSFLYE